MTDGYGADVYINAVGMEADRSVLEKASNVLHAQKGSDKVLENCIQPVKVALQATGCCIERPNSATLGAI